MQKLIDYRNFFQFFLHTPIAVFEDVTNEQILTDCTQMFSYPLVIIKDKNHPLFRKISSNFKQNGIQQEIKIIILAIGYNKPYLA